MHICLASSPYGIGWWCFWVFTSNFVIGQIIPFNGTPHSTRPSFIDGLVTRLRMSNSVQWMRHFALSDTSHPTRPSVPMFSFLLWLKYFSDILRMSGRTPDIRLCAMAAAFFHYRTTRAQFSWVFRCFPFITFHLSFFQIYFHSYLAYLISDISWGTCI